MIGSFPYGVRTSSTGDGGASASRNTSVASRTPSRAGTMTSFSIKIMDPRFLARLRSGSAEDLLRNRDSSHGFWPAGVEGQVGDGLEEFGFGDPILQGSTQVEPELVGGTAGDQGGYGEKAAVPGSEFGPV